MSESKRSTKSGMDANEQSQAEAAEAPPNSLSPNRPASSAGEEDSSSPPPSAPARDRSFLDAIGGLWVSPARAKVLLTLGWPVMIGMLTQTAVNLVDTAMVGRLPTSVSIPGQAALGLSLPLFWAVGGFLSSIQIGTQALVARRYGEGKKPLAGRALMNSLLLGGILAVVVSIIAILLVPVIFPLFHSDPEVIRWGVPYLQVRLVATTGMVATLSIKGFFDAIGRTYVHMIVALVMNIINIFGNWVLIFGNLGAPEMMVTGAAIASAISTMIGLAMIVAWTLHPEMQDQYKPYRWRNRSSEALWSIIRISVPSGIATAAMMGTFLIFMRIGAGLDEELGQGAVFTAATKVVIDLISITFMTCIAFGTATATLVGQSLGRNKPRRAELFGWESAKIGAYFFSLIGALMLLWPDVFLGIFSKDLEVLDAGRPVLRLLAGIQGLVAASIILMQANFGAGNTAFVMKVHLVLQFVFLLPLAYGLGIAAELGLLGMWTSMVVFVILLTLVMGYKFYQGNWKESRV